MRFFVLLGYECLLWILALVAIPKIVYDYCVRKKYRTSLMQKLGFGFPSDFRGKKNGEKQHSHRSIWIHAVSVGETKAIVALAQRLKEHFPDHPLIISSVTETGHQEAKRSLPFADHHVYLPIDFRMIVSSIVKKAAPGLIILSESDFWFHFLDLAKQQGATVVLVNGKISERSANHFHRFTGFSKQLFGLFDLLCVQTERYRKRFIEAGADAEKIVVTGNLKLDAECSHFTPEKLYEWRERLGLQLDELVFVVGSTHRTEEKLLLSVLKNIWKRTPKLRVLLVPRHPERFKEVAELLVKEEVSWTSFTSIGSKSAQVVLIDAMGVLSACYQICDFALVAGSFVEHVGGHNILEPCYYGKPVLFGPYMTSQQELADALKERGGGWQVCAEELQLVIEEWIANPELRKEIGEKGAGLVKQLKGATERTLQQILPLTTGLRMHCKPLN